MKRLSLTLAVLLLVLTVGLALAQTEVRDDASPAPERHLAIDQAEEHERYVARASLEWTKTPVALEQLVAAPKTKAQTVAPSSVNPSAIAACVRNWTRGLRICWYNYLNCSGTFCLVKFDACLDQIDHELDRCLEAAID